MCLYGGSAVPQGAVGDLHLATVPQGAAGDRLPWVGAGRGGGLLCFHAMFCMSGAAQLSAMGQGGLKEKGGD